MKWTALETLFNCGRVDINALSRPHPDAQDTSPDFDQITSHRILPVDTSGSATLYTFVKDRWDQGGQQPTARSLSHENSTGSSSGPSPGALQRAGAQPSEFTLPIHGASDVRHRENPSPNAKERQLQQSLEIQPERQDVPAPHATQTLNNLPALNKPYQNYQQSENAITTQLTPQLNKVNSEGANTVGVTPKQEFPPHQFRSLSISTPSYASQLANARELGDTFQVPMESIEDVNANLWWEQSFDSMELDSYGYLRDKS